MFNQINAILFQIQPLKYISFSFYLLILAISLIFFIILFIYSDFDFVLLCSINYSIQKLQFLSTLLESSKNDVPEIP